MVYLTNKLVLLSIPWLQFHYFFLILIYYNNKIKQGFCHNLTTKFNNQTHLFSWTWPNLYKMEN